MHQGVEEAVLQMWSDKWKRGATLLEPLLCCKIELISTITSVSCQLLSAFWEFWVYDGIWVEPS